MKPTDLMAGVVGRRDHLVRDHRLRHLLETHLPVQRVQDTAISLHVVAADKESGSPIVVSRGDLLDAVMASCAIPRVFPPVMIEGRRLVDGALVAATPVAEALALGATRLFVLPAFETRSLIGCLTGMARTVGLITSAPSVTQGDPASIITLPSPAVGLANPFTFSRTAALIEHGYDLASRFLAEDRPAISPARHSAYTSQGRPEEAA